MATRQTNRLRRAFLEPKYELVTGKGILRRFAKYTLLQMGETDEPNVGHSSESLAEE